MRRAGLAWGAALFLVACGSAGATGSEGGHPSPTASAKPICAPGPCATDNGFSVYVTAVKPNLPPAQYDQLDPGTHLVAVQVRFHSQAQDQVSANPFNFTLRDATGVEHSTAFSTDPECQVWQAVNLTRGASFGPQWLCFEAAGPVTQKLTLIWTPDFGGPSLNIPLG